MLSLPRIGTLVAVVLLVAVPLPLVVAAMARVCALADQPGGNELVRRIGEDEVGRVKADGVPEAELLHARLVWEKTRKGATL